MAVLKVACPKCGQRVSGDDTFYGTTVECPVCSSTIRFPAHPVGNESPAPSDPPAKAASPAPGMPDPGLDFPTTNRQQEAPLPERSATPQAAPPSLETSSIALAPRQPAPASANQGGDAPSPLLGVVSMVLGIVSVALVCLPGILFGPAAIIAGHMALAKARQSRLRLVPGRGAAITGLLLGYISLLGFILITLFVGPWIVEKIRASAPPQ